MRIHFDRATIDRLIAHAKEAPKHRTLYDDPSTAEPALWLVGDQGVYFMSNGSPALLIPGTVEHNVVAYAQEADPTKMSFDAVWDAKRSIFGNDDGVEFLPVAWIEPRLAAYPPDATVYTFVVSRTRGVGISKPRSRKAA